MHFGLSNGICGWLGVGRVGVSVWLKVEDKTRRRQLVKVFADPKDQEDLSEALGCAL